MLRTAIRCAAAGLAACVPTYNPGPTTTTTTTVRDPAGNLLAAGTTTRDSYGNTTTSTPAGVYQTVPTYPVSPGPTYRAY